MTTKKMLLTNIWLFPVAVAILVPSTFILTYIIAVWNEHAQPIFPYISDTGAFPPESCIFGQLLNIAALLMGVVMYLRHRQIAEFYRHAKQSNRWFLLSSTIFLWVGYTSAFGVSMVANFQEPNFFLAHLFGAVLAFAVGLLYCWSQTIFTYLMKPVMHGRWVAHLRLTLVFVSSACFFLMFVFGFYGSGEGGHRNTTSACGGGMSFIRAGEPGYKDHLVTTACEWLMTFAFVMYFMTYAVELKQAVLVPPKLMLTVDQSRLPKDLDYYCRSELSADSIANHSADKNGFVSSDGTPIAFPREVIVEEMAAAGGGAGKRNFFARTLLLSPTDDNLNDLMEEQVRLTKPQNQQIPNSNNNQSSALLGGQIATADNTCL